VLGSIRDVLVIDEISNICNLLFSQGCEIHGSKEHAKNMAFTVE